MKILITGKSGFIGGYLSEKLKHHELYDLECDLLDVPAMSNRLKEVNPDYIIHLAARTEVEKSFYEQTTFSEVNYVGTVNLIEIARHLPKLKLFVFSSTMETYGWQPESDQIKNGDNFNIPVFDEDTPQNPNAPYSVAKLGCEKYLQYAGRAFNFPYCILRQTNTYGRVDNNFFVVEQIITQMLSNPNVINLGYKNPYRNFLWIDDLIDLYEAIISSPNLAAGQVFCTGPDNAISIEKLVEKIAQKMNWTGVINWDTKPRRDGEIFILNSSGRKAERLLGWTAKVDLDTGLDKIINYWREK